MKSIAVVATVKEYADFLMMNVSRYLGKYAEFKSYSIDEVDSIDTLEEDFVLLSAFNIFQKVRRKIGSGSEIIVLAVTLNNKQIEKLAEVPKGTKALLVNFDNRSCMHTITLMYDAGFRDIELYPYYGQEEYDKSIGVAITPNETDLVPEGMDTVIDLGESSVDMNSLFNIAHKLGVYEEFSANEAVDARNELYYINSGMDKLFEDRKGMTEKLNTLIKLMNEGIIITDVLGRIYLTNEKARELLSQRTKILMGFNIEEILPELDINSKDEKLIDIEHAHLIATVVEIRLENENVGHIVTLTDFEEVEEKQHGMRSKLSGTNHVAKHTFEDIIGSSRVMKSVIETGKRIARAEASTMIMGSSGTGKELFAQSIHNASSRRKYNFVAVNCSAIPENLLESEMFGYEEGAFTGAKKGGKIGYFELAHRGTIFLDEIGDMPLQLQSKLLRVLEEKKVSRIGSNKTIDIDVRIISATNRDLYEMVEKGDFREDLYYRLNVLPLSLPDLKDRKEDILTLFYAMADKMDSNIKLHKDVEKTLVEYPWRGNVRELRNMVEFLTSKDKEIIEVEDLPPLKERKAVLEKSDVGHTATIIDKFVLNEGRDIELYGKVLSILNDSLEKRERYGRSRLLEKIVESGGFYTEAEVRKALSKLSGYGFVRSAKGRGGSVITQDGQMLLEIIDEYIERGVLG
ncbi:Sigma-54 interaction domain-containing protein [Dethiosulfatibacter aminovorans DSM 17477]|uniref:Sigma-54 interaction domain-containing protein n=1 Tax=Dethiosulfatibacter aminovorans DSM 17477 TaxID=1121476 RepID=A0A1M6APM9_9FIRM|nr:sigma 54-interacting transcriptional regulator [Dethiosulfatibacter aminovorans]SHI38450.1 Sigma-54 interaction domain-containing protein [Dethiosulfatibacter aminovorans DSM 17477]